MEKMKRTTIYSDDTYADSKNFIISTFIWSDPFACRDYEKTVKEIVEKYKNKKIFQKNFKAFHAINLTHSNWKKMSDPYLEILGKIHTYIHLKQMNSFIYIESRKKFEANTKIIEDSLKEHLLDRKSHMGILFQHIGEEDLKPIYKSVHKMYQYFFHRDKFGGPNTEFKYYPDAAGKLILYKKRKFPVESPGKGQIFMDFITITSLLANTLSETINKPKFLSQLDWKPRPDNQKLSRFEPLKDEDSFLIQTADIISNFFLNLIRYLVGDKSETTKLKANVLLKLNVFQSIFDKIKKNFKLQNGNCVCSNDELKVSISFSSDYTNSGRIIMQ